jgi:hypothetical protein
MLKHLLWVSHGRMAQVQIPLLIHRQGEGRSNQAQAMAMQAQAYEELDLNL